MPTTPDTNPINANENAIIFSENDAMRNSMIWNFDRVKYDAMLREKNKKKLKNTIIKSTL